MRFEDYIGKPALISHLRDTFGSGRAYHAYIFAGPQGTGRKSMARTCAQALFCEAKPEARPCGLCPACLRFTADNPDVYYLRVPEDKTSIPVDSVRALTNSLSDRAFSGGFRPVIVDEAERMLDEAQNALLKTLEEPPEGVVFFLIVPSLGTLLPTVVSRCRVIHFSCLTKEETERELLARGVTEEQSKLIAAISQGSLGTAISLSEDKTFRDLAERVQKARDAARSPVGILEASALLKATKADKAGKAKKAKNAEKTDEAEKDDKAEKAEKTNRDHILRALTLLEALAREEMCAGKSEGARLMKSVINARRRVKSNVYWQYAIEQMFLDAAEGTISDGNGHRSTI